MKRTLKAASVMSLVLTMPHIPAKGQSRDSAQLQDKVLKEIVELRADVMMFLLDAQDRKVKELTRELENVRRRKERLQEEDNQRLQQIANVEQQLASPQLEAPARPQIEALGLELTNESAERIRTEQTGLMQREASLNQRLEREVQRGRKLQERARQLHGVLGDPGSEF